VEELADQVAIADPAVHEAPAVNRVIAPLRDHLLGERAQCLGLGQRGFDPLVLQQRTELVAQQRAAMCRSPAELAVRLVVSHV
jgi:hypothetical protein